MWTKVNVHGETRGAIEMTMSTTTTGTAIDEGQYLSYQGAGRVAGVSRFVVARLAKSGRVASRRIPGCRPRARLEDVLRVVKESTSPANVA
jgi:hypothetical protein